MQSRRFDSTEWTFQRETGPLHVRNNPSAGLKIRGNKSQKDKASCLTLKKSFDDPNAHWSFLTASSDDVFEGQHFDRKEACRKDPSGNIAGAQLKKLKEQIQEVISAFSQSNKEGGLLVLGIGTDGTVRGVDHLTEGQLNDLRRLDDLLIHHARVRLAHALQLRTLARGALTLGRQRAVNCLSHHPPMDAELLGSANDRPATELILAPELLE